MSACRDGPAAGGGNRARPAAARRARFLVGVLALFLSASPEGLPARAEPLLYLPVPDGEPVLWTSEHLRASRPELLALPSYEKFRDRTVEAAMAEAVFEEAAALGLLEAPAVAREYRDFKLRTLPELYLEREVAARIEITDEEYLAALDTEPRPALKLDVLAPRRVGDVPAIEEAIAAGEGFEALVARFGSENTRARGPAGTFGWVERGNPFLSEADWDAAFALGAGGVTQRAVPTATGPVFLHVVRAESREGFFAILKQGVDRRLRYVKFKARYPSLIEELVREFGLQSCAGLDDPDVSARALAENGGVAARAGPYTFEADEAVVQAPGRPGWREAARGGGDFRLPLRGGYRGRCERMLLALKAEHGGLDRDPAWRERLRGALARPVWGAYLEHLRGAAPAPSEAELRQYFEETETALFRRRPSVTLWRFHPVGEAESASWFEKAALRVGVRDALALAEAEGVSCRVLEGVAVEDLPVGLREALGVRRRGDVFAVPENGALAVYRVAARTEEDYRPPFEEVRGQVQSHLIEERRARAVGDRVAELRGLVRWDEDEARRAYETARARGAAP